MSLAIEVATPGSFDGLPTKKNFDRRFDWSCHSITTTFGTVTGQDRGEVVRGQAHSRPLTNERVLKNQTSLTPKIYRHQAFGLYSQWFSRATKHAQDKNSSGRPQLRPRKLDHLEPKFKKNTFITIQKPSNYIYCCAMSQNIRVVEHSRIRTSARIRKLTFDGMPI